MMTEKKRTRNDTRPSGEPRGRKPLSPDAVRVRAQIYLNAAELRELNDVGGSTTSECVQILLAERRERRETNHDK